MATILSETKRICNFEECSVELKPNQLCVYCDNCLPNFLELYDKNIKQDNEDYIKFEKESIERRKQWLNTIEDANYRDTMKKNFKYYKDPKYILI